MVSVSSSAQDSYYLEKAKGYIRDAEYYTKKAEGYDRESEYYNKKAQGYLREADYYSRNKKYDKANTIQVKLKLNLKTDSDILEALERSGNKQGYIKRLIRADIK